MGRLGRYTTKSSTCHCISVCPRLARPAIRGRARPFPGRSSAPAWIFCRDGKTGALYDEVINVPLYISMPTFSKTGNPRQSQAVPRSFVCSSVDILPLVYSLALGNESWRCNSNDIINYLNGRESIRDAIYAGTATQQRRLSSFTNAYPLGTANWQQYQPFVLVTTDEYYYVTSLPSHAVAFRTVDPTIKDCNTSPCDNTGHFGGGKLGVYSYWQTNSTKPDTTQPQQFEFY